MGFTLNFILVFPQDLDMNKSKNFSGQPIIKKVLSFIYPTMFNFYLTKKKKYKL